MTLERYDLHWWLQRWPQLKKVGNEYKGPCPNCGGKDRFWVRKDGIIGCRRCRDYIAILEAVGAKFSTKEVSRLLFRRPW